MDLIKEAFTRLFPEKELFYNTKIEYNRRLGSFNANIRMSGNTITIHFNLEWKGINEEIKIGLIQSLLLKIFKEKKQTPNMELYRNFIKNIPLIASQGENNSHEPVLEKSFCRINDRFFENSLKKPNLIWGQQSFRRLASYNFHSDAVIISSIFKDAQQEVIDYLMYHELLHKSYQFESKNGRNSFHTKAFREAEKRYSNLEQIEQEVKKIVRMKRRTSSKQKTFLRRKFFTMFK